MKLGSITVLGRLDYVIDYFMEHAYPKYELRTDVDDMCELDHAHPEFVKARTPYMLQLDCENKVAYVFRMGTSNPMNSLNTFQIKAIEATADLVFNRSILYTANGVHYHKLVLQKGVRECLAEQAVHMKLGDLDWDDWSVVTKCKRISMYTTRLCPACIVHFEEFWTEYDLDNILALDCGIKLNDRQIYEFIDMLDHKIVFTTFYIK